MDEAWWKCTASVTLHPSRREQEQEQEQEQEKEQEKEKEKEQEVVADALQGPRSAPAIGLHCAATRKPVSKRTSERRRRYFAEIILISLLMSQARCRFRAVCDSRTAECTASSSGSCFSIACNRASRPANSSMYIATSGDVTRRR